MGGKILSTEAYKRVEKKVKKAGSATHVGEQRLKEGKGLHELVDPKGFGVIRRSISWLEPEDDHFVLLRGTAILEETRLDTTSSMGDSVDIAFDVLPKTHNLLAKIPTAVLGRYDVHMITSIFGDIVDEYILCRSQAEIDERIAEQMTLMVPERAGGDFTEDPQYGLFGAAFLTRTSIQAVGLKSYDFTITDATGRDYFSVETLKRVFGDSVFEKVHENEHQIEENNLPNTKEVVQQLLTTAHAFLLQVGDYDVTTNYWTGIFGADRVIMLPRTELLPEVKAAIIGLTEGVLSLQDIEKFLIDEANLSPHDAAAIKTAVAGIPIGAQTMLPNFNKIPLKGDIFAKKGDVWPTADSTSKDGKKDENWL